MIYYNVVLLVVLLVLIYFIATMRKRPRCYHQEYADVIERLSTDDLDGAVERTRKLWEKEPDNVKLYLVLGDILRKQGKYDKAVRIYLNALVNRNLRDKERVYKGILLSYLGLDPERIKNFLKKPPPVRSEENLKLLLQLQERAGLWEDAVETARRLSWKPEEYSDYVAYIALVSGKKEEILKKAGRLTPSPMLLYVRGLVAFEKGNKDEAVKNFTECLKKNPSLSFLVMDKLEEASFEAGKYGEVEKLYEELLEKEPRNPEIITGFANVLAKKGKMREAVDVLEKHAEGVSSLPLLSRRLLISLETDKERALELAGELAKKVMESKKYRCKVCGNEEKEYPLRCSRCGSLLSYIRVWE